MRNSNQVFWEWAAEQNPYHYIATSRKDWTPQEFFRDGEWRMLKWVIPWLLASGVNLQEVTFLDVGCGAGRFGLHVSKYVKKYIGVDISKQNLELFKKHITPAHQNIELLLGDGYSLKEIGEKSVDVIFSYAVLQHVWEKETILSYLDESVRVLADKGIAKLHLAGSNRTSGFKMRYLRTQTLGKKRFFSRFLKAALPGDFLVPAPFYYRAGNGLQGEGLCYKKAIRYMTAKGVSAKVEPFENHNLASRYWLLFAKDSSLDMDGAYTD